MSTHAMTEARPPRGAERGLRWIGDLDHPFYSDERNRFVWYEASAIGFQLLFLGNYFVTGIMLWVVGGSAIPYALTLFIPTMIAAIVFQGYLRRHSAEYWPGRNDLVRRRGQFAVLAGIVLLAGIVRAAIDLQGPGNGLVSSTVLAVIFGGLSGVAVLVFKSRQAAKAENVDEF